MSQFPGSGVGWLPIGEQFLDASASTALTIPSPTTLNPGLSSTAGMDYVAILQAQGAAQWIREDGTTVTAAASGGLKMEIGDWKFIYGLPALKAVRVIRDASGGSLAVMYYIFRKTT